MSTSDSPQIIQIEVEPHEVNLTLEDIVNPLLQAAGNLAQGQPGTTLDPEVAQHVQNLADLLTQLKDVYTKINQINPALLRSSLQPPTSS